jgi:hypothetical protein
MQGANKETGKVPKKLIKLATGELNINGPAREETTDERCVVDTILP